MLHGTLITRCCCPCWSIGGGVCRRQESKDTKQFALFLLHVLCKDRICVSRTKLKQDESLLFQSIGRSWSSLDLPGRTVLCQTPQQESRNPSTFSPRQCHAACAPLSGLEGDARNPGETSSKTSIVSLFPWSLMNTSRRYCSSSAVQTQKLLLCALPVTIS